MKTEDILKRIKSQREKIDVVLIHIEPFFEERYSYFNTGLLYIATLLKNSGFKVKCLGINELFRMSFSDVRRIFTLSSPKIVGFYTISDNQYLVSDFAHNIKKWNPNCLVVVGGPLATSLGPKILDDNPHYDICVIGEGEYVMLDIARWKIKKEGKIEDIPSIIYREKGKYRINPQAPPIKDLDSLPYPDHSLITPKTLFPIVTGRGCPFNCLFCFQGVHGLKYRFRGIDSILDEIITNMETGKYHSFHIIDDTFISSPKRVEEISKRLIKYRKDSGRNFVFFCQGRANVIHKHPHLLNLLKEAGLIRVQIGIESGNPETLKIYNKKITVEEIKGAVEKVNSVGNMTIVGNFILGGPFENDKTFEDSINLLKNLIEIAPGVFEGMAGFLGPYPGTPIALHPEKYGLIPFDTQFKKGQTLSDVHLETVHLTANQLREKGKIFWNTLENTMEKVLPKIPPPMMASHFFWAEEYGIFTYWYQKILSKKEGLVEFFYFLKSPRYKMFHEIPQHEILDWKPQRIIEKRKYTKNGKTIILPITVGKYYLRKKEDILIYELSSGKLTIKQMIKEFKQEMKLDLSNYEVLKKYFFPLFQKLQKKYHILFYK